MDKYQKYIFEKFDLDDNFIFNSCCPTGLENIKKTANYGLFDRVDNSFNIIQDENITITRYSLVIDTKKVSNNPFSSVLIQKDSQWIEIPFVDKKYNVVLDFDNRLNAIKFTFANRIADDYVLKITYTEADRAKYFARLEQEKKENLLKKIDIKVSTGADLVNIYFQPCCNKYDHTEIMLYIPKEEKNNGYTSTNTLIIDVLSWSLIKKCDLPSDIFYLSINGLAYGKYSFVLKQFDENGNTLIETDHIIFSIVRPFFQNNKRIVGI